MKRGVPKERVRRIVEGPLHEEWVERGACVGSDMEVFFPHRGTKATEAKQICAGCKVRAECLDYALRTPELFGVWGGRTEKERKGLRRARRVA